MFLRPTNNYLKNLDWYSNQSFVWGKATKLSPTEFDAVSAVNSCKDLIVDTFYRERYKKVEKQLQECFFYIFCPMDKRERLLKTIPSFLHAYEDRMGFTHTTIDVCEEKVNKDHHQPIIIQGDSRWTKNAHTVALYLTLIRLCAYHEDMTVDAPFASIKYDERQINSGDIENYDNLDQPKKDFVDYVLQNPSCLFHNVPKGLDSMTGYASKYSVTHGICGVFGILTGHSWFKGKIEEEMRVQM